MNTITYIKSVSDCAAAIEQMKKYGITLDSIAEELNYRDGAGDDSRWDNKLYPYTTEELEKIEINWIEYEEVLRKVRFIDTNNNYIDIAVLAGNRYIIENEGCILTGFYEKIDDTSHRVRLECWYNKKTKQNRSRGSQGYKHQEYWFACMVQKGIEMLTSKSGLEVAS